MNYAPVEEAIATIARGEMVLVVDDEERENEGDLIVAAEKVTPQHIAFMVRYTSGLICLPMTGERLDELGQIEEHLRVLGGDLLDFSAFSAVKLG